MSDTDLELLQLYTRDHAEDAFAELVRRHLDLVFSAALRQVRSPQLAEEVAQSTFTDLAHNASRLAPDTILAAWLYQVTRRTAIDVVRREARRQLREQIATEMNALNANDADWTQIEPLLDDAMEALDETDRTAILLRYFENKSLREVGLALGASDDAAQKRVSRAVERLREFFSKRGVAAGAGGLAVVISANAVQAAPAALALTISTAATLTGTTVATTVTATTIKTIAMTTIQKTLITATLAILAGAGIYEARKASQLQEANQTLQQKIAQLEPMAQQVQQLQREHDDATNRVASLAGELAAAKKNPSEVLKLRSEVGTLRQEKAALGSQSALNKLTADPETRKMLREQQKRGMSGLYGDLTKQIKLSSEQKEQFNDLLADQIMDSIDLITQTLHDKTPRDEMDRAFAALDSAAQEKMLALISPESLARYQDYTKNLGSTLTASQFEGSLTGEKAAKAEKKSQLLQMMKEETQNALSAAGLPSDYQTVPMLNLRNIASEEQGDRSLKLLSDIYDRVGARATSFLDEEELKKFQEFKAKALENSKAALLMNRQLMAPLSK